MDYYALPEETDAKEVISGALYTERLLALVFSFFTRCIFLILRISVVRQVSFETLVVCNNQLATDMHEAVLVLVIVDLYVFGVLSTFLGMFLASDDASRGELTHSAYKAIMFTDIGINLWVFGQVWYRYSKETLPLVADFYANSFAGLECLGFNPTLEEDFAYMDGMFKVESYVLLISLATSLLVLGTYILAFLLRMCIYF